MGCVSSNVTVTDDLKRSWLLKHLSESLPGGTEEKHRKSADLQSENRTWDLPSRKQDC